MTRLVGTCEPLERPKREPDAPAASGASQIRAHASADINPKRTDVCPWGVAGKELKRPIESERTRCSGKLNPVPVVEVSSTISGNAGASRVCPGVSGVQRHIDPAV
ncbi:MAG: hypothetical protein H0V20_05015 [Actinobacteria bacterium]|nr:hypothetical protein [Actinomycetota bacterium]